MGRIENQKIRRDRKRERDREYRRTHKEMYKSQQLRRWYGITIEQYKQMLSSQNNRCAICGNTFKIHRGTHVDHNHQTGKVRGLLCNGCNIGIGSLKDSLIIVRAAVKYLEQYDI